MLKICDYLGFSDDGILVIIIYLHCSSNFPSNVNRNITSMVIETLFGMQYLSVENRARPPARYQVKKDAGGQIRHPARPAGQVTFHKLRGF